MKRVLLFMFVVFSVALSGDLIYVVNSISGTLSKVDTETGEVNNTFVQLGTTPNLIDVGEEFAFVVNSGDNAVQKIDLTTGQTVSNIYLEDSANPWYAKVDGNYLFVTGFFTNKLYKIDLTTEEIVAEAIVGEAPAGIEFYQEKVYVTCTGGYMNNYVDSQVTVLTKDSLEMITTIPTSLNPQYVNYYEGKIFVMCTGNWTDAPSKVEIINPENDTITTTLDVGGNIGKATFINNRCYITDAMNFGIYVIDTETETLLHDSSNPLTPGGSTIANNGNKIAYVNAAWGTNGTLYVTDANLQNPQSFEVALAPTDVIFGTTVVPISDNDVALPQIGVRTFPNPTSDQLNFSLSNTTRSLSQVAIYNLKGQLIDSFATAKSEFSWQGRTKNGEPLANGIYFYRVVNEGSTVSGKFLKLK